MIAFTNFSFWYPGRANATLRQIDFAVGPGEFVLLTGPTGCGKSTLLKCLNGVIPHLSGGKCEGEIFIHGQDTRTFTMGELSAEVGLVQQSPDDQIFATCIQDEVAFGPENLCLDRDKIEEQVTWALKAVELDGYRQRSTNALSGGQKQRLALAAMLSLNPRILALDEPVSQLDPQGADEVMAVIRNLNKKYGVTVVMVEHRIHEVAQFVDRMVVMENGRIAYDAPVREAMLHADEFVAMGLRLPETVEISRRFHKHCAALTVQETVDLLKSGCPRQRGLPAECSEDAKGEPAVVAIEDLFYRYGKQDQPALCGVNLKVRQGEKVAVMGRNGSGKSTLLAHMAGMIVPQQGVVTIAGQLIRRRLSLPLGTVGLVMQNPDLMLFHRSVRQEVIFGLENLKLEEKIRTERYSKAMEGFALTALQADPPLSLSRGQRLRTATAAVAAMNPSVIFLDEPTTGQDQDHIDSMMTSLLEQAETVVFCTHDVETVIRYASRVVVMEQGRIVADEIPRKIFADEPFLLRYGLRPTQSWLVGRTLGLEDVFTPGELERRWSC
ncbi:MAG: ABC transporter ATP-binding protein [Veillonellales bacterium]